MRSAAIRARWEGISDAVVGMVGRDPLTNNAGTSPSGLIVSFMPFREIRNGTARCTSRGACLMTENTLRSGG